MKIWVSCGQNMNECCSCSSGSLEVVRLRIGEGKVMNQRFECVECRELVIENSSWVNEKNLEVLIEHGELFW